MWAKLTNEQVNEIRARYVPRDRKNGARALGREYGVCHQAISNIINEKSWRSV